MRNSSGLESTGKLQPVLWSRLTRGRKQEASVVLYEQTLISLIDRPSHLSQVPLKRDRGSLHLALRPSSGKSQRCLPQDPPISAPLIAWEENKEILVLL